MLDATSVALEASVMESFFAWGEESPTLLTGLKLFKDVTKLGGDDNDDVDDDDTTEEELTVPLYFLQVTLLTKQAPNKAKAKIYLNLALSLLQ